MARRTNRSTSSAWSRCAVNSRSSRMKSITLTSKCSSSTLTCSLFSKSWAYLTPSVSPTPTSKPYFATGLNSIVRDSSSTNRHLALSSIFRPLPSFINSSRCCNCYRPSKPKGRHLLKVKHLSSRNSQVPLKGVTTINHQCQTKLSLTLPNKETARLSNECIQLKCMKNSTWIFINL